MPPPIPSFTELQLELFRKKQQTAHQKVDVDINTEQNSPPLNHTNTPSSPRSDTPTQQSSEDKSDTDHDHEHEQEQEHEDDLVGDIEMNINDQYENAESENHHVEGGNETNVGEPLSDDEKHFTFGALYHMYIESQKPEKLQLSNLVHGDFRCVTQFGKEKLLKAVRDSAGNGSDIMDGLLPDEYFVVVKRPDISGLDPLPMQYEVIDGNHRLDVFRELGVELWNCIVINNLDPRSKFVLASGLNQKHDQWAVHSSQLFFLSTLLKHAESECYLGPPSGNRIRPILFERIGRDMGSKLSAEHLRRQYKTASLIQERPNSWAWLMQQNDKLGPNFKFRLSKYDFNSILTTTTDFALLRTLKASCSDTGPVNKEQTKDYLLNQNDIAAQLGQLADRHKHHNRDLELVFESVTTPFSASKFKQMKRIGDYNKLVEAIKNDQSTAKTNPLKTNTDTSDSSSSKKRGGKKDERKSQSKKHKSDSSPTSNTSKSNDSSTEPGRPKSVAVIHPKEMDANPNLDLINEWFTWPIREKMVFDFIFCVASAGDMAASKLFEELPSGIPPIAVLIKELNPEGILAVFCPNPLKDDIIPYTMHRLSMSIKNVPPLVNYAKLTICGSSATRSSGGPKIASQQLHLFKKGGSSSTVVFVPNDTIPSDTIRISRKSTETAAIGKNPLRFTSIPFSFWPSFFSAFFC